MKSKSKTAHSRLERALVDRKVPLYALLFVVMVGLMLTSIFGWAVRHTYLTEDPVFGGRIASIVRRVASFPELVEEAFLELGLTRLVPAESSLSDDPHPPQTIKDHFPEINGFSEGGIIQHGATVDLGYILFSVFDIDHAQSVVQLIRIRDQNVVHEWIPDTAQLHRRTARLRSPILLADGGLVYQVTHGGDYLVKLDACGKLVWRNNEYLFHHGVQKGSDGYFWALGNVKGQQERFFDSFGFPSDRSFVDNIVLKVSPEGKIVYRKRMSEIFQENDLPNILYGTFISHDFFHSNDVEPALTSTKYWNKDDLLISARNRNRVLLYRPSSGRVLFTKQGPWASQHDPDFLGNSQISVFGNDVVFVGTDGADSVFKKNNEIYIWDLSDGSIKTPYSDLLEKYDVRTAEEGTHSILSNGDLFLEETNRGRLLRLSETEGRSWQMTRKSGRAIALPSWSRYLSEDDVREVFPILGQSNCNH